MKIIWTFVLFGFAEVHLVFVVRGASNVDCVGGGHVVFTRNGFGQTYASHPLINSKTNTNLKPHVIM